MGYNWGFFLREALKNLRLNLLMSATAMTTTAICVFVLGMGMLVSAHVGGIMRQAGQDVAVTAYFPDDASEERVEQVRGSVEGYPEVESVVYVSKSEAYERFKEMMADQPDIYESIGSDALPASLEIQLNNSSGSEAVAERLEAEGFARQDIEYPQQTVESIDRVTDYVVWGLRGATALFFVASVLLIFNTIRLSIFARRKEIEVMKLVGASDEFVRTPFLLEGLVQGLLGATIAALLVVWIDSLFVGWAHEYLPLVGVSSEAVGVFSMLAVLISVGAVVGVLGSFFSIRRFLKV